MTPARLARALVASAAGVVLVGAVGAAWAEGFVTVPPDPVTEHRTVTLTGDVDATERDRIDLRLAAPGTSPVTVASLDPADTTDRARSLSAELDTASCNQAAACGRGTAPNGSWDVQLVSVGPAELGGEERVLASAALVLDVPARAPSGVRAEVTAPRRVSVSWARGTEPDLRQWQVTDGGGTTRTVTPDDACSGERCSVGFDYAPTDSGTRTYGVAATRACGTGDCEPPSSATTSTGAVDIGTVGTAPPPAGSEGAPAPSGSPAPGGVGTADTRSLGLGLGLGSFGPSVPAPALPIDPLAPSVAAPEVAPGGSGSLDLQDRIEVQGLDEPTVQADGRPAAMATTTGAVLGGEELARSIAGALVLLLGAAHLRTWLTRGRREDTAEG